jgi:hypothetical protein
MRSSPIRTGLRLLAAAMLAGALLSDCTHSGSDGGSAGASPSASAVEVTPSATPGTATSVTAAPATEPPQPTTGLMVVTLGDGTSYVGHFVTPVLFQPCASATTIPFTSDDTVRDGGECAIAFSDAIRPAVSSVLGGGPPALVTSLAVSDDGNAAVATYIKGRNVGQVLLTKKDGTWTAVRSTAGMPLNDAHALSGGVSPAILHTLQSRLKFDLATPVKVGTVPASH